jgi:Peptidase M66
MLAYKNLSAQTTGIAVSQALLCAWVLAGCGGGGSSDVAPAPAPGPSATAPPASVPIKTTPSATQVCPAQPAASPSATTSAVVANIELAQSLVFNSADSALVLVAGKDVLVKVNITTQQPGEPKPEGVLRVETSTGQLVQTITLTPPTGALGACTSVVPSFTDSYTAVLPGSLVKTGLRLTASVPNGQTPSTINPRVGGGVAIKYVVVPVQIAGATGSVPNAASYIQPRIPAVSVTQENHAPYTAKGVTALPTTEKEWEAAFGKLLKEMDDLYTLENAPKTSYYYGSLPKKTYGLAGFGYISGNASIGFDVSGTARDTVNVLETLTHELGHNLSLLHAPCGTNVSSPDPQYPYANAKLGAGSRFVWGYNAPSKTFIDPRNTARHDIMSYCDGDTFSDYNYRKIQVHLSPADAQLGVATAARSITGPQDLLLISGQIAAGKAQLKPIKSFYGEPKLLPDGPYTLRIVTAAQGTLEYRFASKVLDHDSTQQHFGFTIPHPGEILSMSIVKDGAVMMQTAAKVSATTADKTANSGIAKTQTAASAKPQVQISEQGGMLRLTWDHATYPYLTVTHVGAQRSNLAQDLEGGSATLPMGQLPAGGSYEFSLSDGINAVRVTTPRS